MLYRWIRLWNNSASDWEPARIYNKSGMILEGEGVIIGRIGWLKTYEGNIEMRGDTAVLRDEDNDVWEIGGECLQH
jgi:hypothetical protein